jgi:hypothetical protein
VRLLLVRSTKGSCSNILFLLLRSGEGTRGGPIGIRPLPLSIATRDDRFSLSEDTEVTGEGDIECCVTLLRLGRPEGGGEAS